MSNTTTTCSLRQKGPLTQSHTFFTHIIRAVSEKSFNSTKSQTVREKIHDCAMPCILTTIYVLTFLKPSTMYRPRCSEMISGLWSAFGTCWVVQCHPSIEYNPRISTPEHVHALCFLSHIGCTVTINRVEKVPEKMSLHWLKANLWWSKNQSKGVLYKKSASFSDGNSSKSIDPTTVI